MSFKDKRHVFYVEAILEVPVVLKILGIDEQEAFARTNDGAWHDIMAVDLDKAKVKAIGAFTKGPGIN